MKNKKSYFSIITADVRYDETLPPSAKLMYAEITALCHEKGYCWANNNYFKELYGTTTRSVSRWIAALAKAGYIVIKTNREKGNKRHIYLAYAYGQKRHGVWTKMSKGQDKNVQHNNIRNNKKDIYSGVPPQDIDQIMKIFYRINPTLVWGNKTTRKACGQMIKKWGLETTRKMAEMVVSVQGEKYAPTATTPYQMQQKLAQFKIYFQKEKNNKPRVAKIS